MENLDAFRIFGAFFAVMNPFINLPMFLALTTDFSVREQRVLAIKVIFFSTIMCTVILFAGQSIISFFGISIDLFRIAGGLVLANIAWTMLNGGDIASHQGSAKEQDQMSNLTALAFYPLTFPLIVGPGTIATLIIYAGHASSPTGLLVVGATLASVLLIMLVVLYFASFFGKVLSQTLRVIMTRLMGLILLSIAVEMIIAGATALLPGLA